MKKLYSFFISTLLVSSAVCAGGTDYTKGLAIWFDAPNTLQGHAVWYGGRPDMWKGENKPETAGDTARNPDAAWESQSLPIGNGSIGANIMGSVEAERITFNEKTLWRGGPNTAKGRDRILIVKYLMRAAGKSLSVSVVLRLWESFMWRPG